MESGKTIHVSITWIILAGAAVVLLGVAGGYFATWLTSPTFPLVSPSDHTIVPVSQQITLSPGKAYRELTSSHAESVLLLVHQTQKTTVPFGIGTMVTSDGVVMTVPNENTEQVLGIGKDGGTFPLTFIGKDVLTGTFFYKITDHIVVPVALAQTNPQPGDILIGIERSEITTLPSASIAFAQRLSPAQPQDAPGLQKLLEYTTKSQLLPGTPLFLEDGSLAAISFSKTLPTAVLVSDISSALNRLTAGQSTLNPFSSLGFTASWQLVLTQNGTYDMRPVVSSVERGGPAATSGISIGDQIEVAGGNVTTWDTSFSEALKSPTVELGIIRNGEARTITITSPT